MHAILPAEVEAIWLSPRSGGRSTAATARSLAGAPTPDASPSTFLRVLAAHGLVLPEHVAAPARTSHSLARLAAGGPTASGPAVTHFSWARCAFAVVDLVSQK